MSRSGYRDDLDNDWSLIRYRGQVTSATRGKRGQKLLLDLLHALDALPEKRLVRDVLVDSDGDVCALGALAIARGMDTNAIDPEDAECVARNFDIAEPLAREIVYENDEGYYDETPEQLFIRMRKWVVACLLPVPIDEPHTAPMGHEHG